MRRASAKHWWKAHFIKAAIRDYAALLAIKRGEQPWPEVNAWRLRLHKEFDEAFASTRLSERPDYAWANEFLLKARRGNGKFERKLNQCICD